MAPDVVAFCNRPQYNCLVRTLPSGRLGVVVNPAASRGRLARGARAGVGLLGESGYRLLNLSADNTQEALQNAKRAVADGIDALIVVGGDGMAHLGVNAVAGSAVPLGVLATGSGNDFARAAGLPTSDPVAAARVVLNSLHKGARSTDAMALTLDTGERRWGLCVVSAGLDAEVNARANTYRWPRGGTRYLRAALRSLKDHQPYGYRLSIDGDIRELTGSLIAVSNTPYIGGGMKIAPSADPDDGFLDVVIAEAIPPGELVQLLPRLYNGSHLRHPSVSVERARVVTIEPLPGFVSPPEPMMDGEPLNTKSVRIEIVPGAVQVLRP